MHQKADANGNEIPSVSGSRTDEGMWPIPVVGVRNDMQPHKNIQLFPA